jgi:glycosyltransferase 2 family protein
VKRAWRRLAIGIATGVAVFAGFSIYADVSELGDRLAAFSWWALAAALGLAALNYGLRLWRWNLYLRDRGIEVPRRTSALVFFSGFALSITPGKVGELVKSVFLRQSTGVPITRSAPIVVAERLTDLIALVLLGLFGVALYGVGAEIVAASAALVIVGLLVLAFPPVARRVISLLCRPRPLHKLGARLLQVYEGLAELVRPRPLARATGLGAVAWLAECTAFAVICAGFAGTEVPLGLATLIFAAATLAGALSFLPGGLLVTEAGMTLLLVRVAGGFDEPTAVAATILTRLATLWFAVLIGIVALGLLRRELPDADRALDEASSR